MYMNRGGAGATEDTEAATEDTEDTEVATEDTEDMEVTDAILALAARKSRRLSVPLSDIRITLSPSVRTRPQIPLPGLTQRPWPQMNTDNADSVLDRAAHRCRSQRAGVFPAFAISKIRTRHLRLSVANNIGVHLWCLYVDDTT